LPKNTPSPASSKSSSYSSASGTQDNPQYTISRSLRHVPSLSFAHALQHITVLAAVHEELPTCVSRAFELAAAHTSKTPAPYSLLHSIVSYPYCPLSLLKSPFCSQISPLPRVPVRTGRSRQDPANHITRAQAKLQLQQPLRIRPIAAQSSIGGAC
jgi:hypothetical protein